MQTKLIIMTINSITCTVLFCSVLQLKACQDGSILAKRGLLERITTNPIIIGKDQGANVSKEYSWAGTGISNFYGWDTKKIAEIWFFSTQKDGLTQHPETKITLKDLIEHETINMLGHRWKNKPVFCKILGKDEHQPQILHSGFTESIVGNHERFIKLCQIERSLVVRLKDALAQYIHSEGQFADFKKSYDQWTSKEIRSRWTHEEMVPELPPFMHAFDCSIFGQLQKIRKQLVSFLNEIPLQEGNVILSPVGNIHSIVGSHQMHPPAEHPDAKNEAYYIFLADSGSSAGEKKLLYFEPQQTSNTTYSPFDFASPLEFKNGSVVMRKDLRQGLDALLGPTKVAPATEDEAIEIMMSKAITFQPTSVQDLVLDSKIQDCTHSPTYFDSHDVHVDSLIEGTYKLWPREYFKLERLTFEANKESAITVHPVEDSYHELFVIKGSVSMNFNGTITALSQGSSAFVPAAYKKNYQLMSSDYAQVLKVSPGSTAS